MTDEVLPDCTDTAELTSITSLRKTLFDVGMSCTTDSKFSGAGIASTSATGSSDTGDSTFRAGVFTRAGRLLLGKL